MPSHRHRHGGKAATGASSQPTTPSTETRLAAWRDVLVRHARREGARDLVATPPPPLCELAWESAADVLERHGEELRVLPKHACADVTEADIQRSLYDVLDLRRRSTLRRQLREMVLRAISDSRVEVVLGGTPIHYYQGVHDILSVLLHASCDALAERGAGRAEAADDDQTSGDENDSAVVAPRGQTFEHLVQTSQLLLVTKFRRFARPDMAATLNTLKCIHEEIIVPENPELASMMEQSGLSPDTHFAMAWIITWFGHDLNEYPELLNLLFDECIASEHDLHICFVTAALVLRYVPDAIAEIGEDHFTDPAGFGDAHQALKNLPLRLVTKRRVGGSVHSAHRERRSRSPLAPAGKLKKAGRIAALEGVLADAKALEAKYLARFTKVVDGEASDSDGDDAAVGNSSVASSVEGSSAAKRGRWPAMAFIAFGVAVHVGLTYAATTTGAAA